MGTRSITLVMDQYNPTKELCRIYRQHDGYPQGHGADLMKLCDVQIVNGLTDLSKDALIANGMGCLAARIIKGLKDRPGGIYLHVPQDGEPDEDYTYIVTGEIGKKPVVTCKAHNGVEIFKGTADEVNAAETL